MISEYDKIKTLFYLMKAREVLASYPEIDRLWNDDWEHALFECQTSKVLDNFIDEIKSLKTEEQK